MFFKDIDAWGKRKLRLITLLCGLLYVVFATMIPVIIINKEYDLIKEARFSASFVGVIVITIVVTAGFKAVKWVIGILPEIKRTQQIIKFGLEMLIALIIVGAILYLTFIVENGLNQALFCIRGVCYSYIGAIIVEYTCMKPIQVQWQFEAKVDSLEKEETIKFARK